MLVAPLRDDAGRNARRREADASPRREAYGVVDRPRRPKSRWLYESAITRPRRTGRLVTTSS